MPAPAPRFGGACPRWGGGSDGEDPSDTEPKSNIAPRCGTSGSAARGSLLLGGFRDGCQFLARLTMENCG